MEQNNSENMIHLEGWSKGPDRFTPLPDCSLVVATYGRPSILMDLLQSLARLEDLPGEVLIVDASEGTEGEKLLIEFADAHRLPFKLCYVRGEKGLTKQRNIGVDGTTGDYVFFLDDDCVPLPGYFRTIRDGFEEPRYGRIGGICGSIINEMDRPLMLRWRLRFKLGLVPRGEPGTYYDTATSVPRAMAKPFKGFRKVDILPGGATAYTREVLVSHRFSEFFHGYSQGEDLEMSTRVGKEFSLLWCGDAYVLHNHKGGGRPGSFAKGYMEVRNRCFVWLRNSNFPPLVVRIRFWSDIVFTSLLSIAGFIRSPWRPGYLAHALGMTWGMMVCLVHPPVHNEPAAKKKYAVDLKPVKAVG
jgi:GT2 family glycosyltransferase